MIPLSKSTIRYKLGFLCSAVILQMSIMTGVRSNEVHQIADAEGASSAVFIGLGSGAWDRILLWSLVATFAAMMLLGLAAAGSALTHRRDAAIAKSNPKQPELASSGSTEPSRAEGSSADQVAGQNLGKSEPSAPSDERLLPRVTAVQPPPQLGQGSQPNESRKGLRNAAISAEAAKVLTRELRAHPGNVSIDYDGVDIQTQPLGVQLQDAFSDAGWNVSSGIMLGISTKPRSGILIRGNNHGLTSSQERAVRAFGTAGIPFDLRRDREPKIYTSGQAHTPFGMGADDVEIVVTFPQQ